MEPGWKSPSSAICRSRVDLSSTKGGNGSGMGPPRLKVLHTLRFRPQKMKLRDPSLSCRALLHIAIHDKVVLNSSMGNQPENIEEPTGSGDPFHVEEISTGIRHLCARRGERRNLSRYPVPAFQGRGQAVEGR